MCQFKLLSSFSMDLKDLECVRPHQCPERDEIEAIPLGSSQKKWNVGCMVQLSTCQVKKLGSACSALSCEEELW